MNRYPLWKNLLILAVLALGLLYTLPNFFGEVPAVQVTSARATLKVDTRVEEQVLAALREAGLANSGTVRDATSLRVKFADTDAQLKGRDAIERALNPDPKEPSFTIALNLLSATPGSLAALGAKPMYLGLDLRGGVHFLLQVDMKGALTKRLDATAADLRSLLREKSVRYGGIIRDGMQVEMRFRDAQTREAARNVIRDNRADLQLRETEEGDQLYLVANLTPPAQQQIQESALKQNINTLHNRINELGVAEPIIQQQGLDRIVVQLPGVQDVAKAKELLGRTATLEIRMVEDSPEALQQALAGAPPSGTELYRDREEQLLLVKKQVVLTGDRLTDAQPGFDNQTQEAVVNLTLDAAGSRIFRDVTRDNVGRRMAILLIEKGRGEVVTAPVIRSEITGGRVQISGNMTTEEATDIALLLRAGSLAAPMEIIEERTVGPSLGAENIAKGFNSTLWGFVAIGVFMIAYYLLFGGISMFALAANLLLLVALLSLLQATLTLPGIAAIALTLGMAIDANVLINERIREELRNGVPPQTAINTGYERAFGTILDSNVTTLIAGVALYAFGSGPVRGFAVVHCLGILTSMFSAVLVSRMLANFVYGRQRKLDQISIGQVWKPGAGTRS